MLRKVKVQCVDDTNLKDNKKIENLLENYWLFLAGFIA